MIAGFSHASINNEIIIDETPTDSLQSKETNNELNWRSTLKSLA